MSVGNILAETGTALRSSLAAWLASTESGAPAGAVVVTEIRETVNAGTASGLANPAALMMKLVHVATSSSLRNTPRPSARGGATPAGPALRGLELEYLLWPVAGQAVDEERLIGAALEWLVGTPVLEVKADGVACRVTLTELPLGREELARLWSAAGAWPLLAFSARIAQE